MNLTPVSGLSYRSLLRKRFGYLSVLVLIIVALSTGESGASAADPVRSVLVELYFRTADKELDTAVDAIEKLRAARGGITLVLRDTKRESKNQERLDALLRHYRVASRSTPVVYGCDRVIVDFSKANDWRSQLREMFTLEVFVRTGCSHCAAAEKWLPDFMKEYPGLELIYRDISVDSESAARLSQIVEQHKTMAASVPVFYVADQLLVGFESESSTGERLRKILKNWTHVPRLKSRAKPRPTEDAVGSPPTSMILRNAAGAVVSLISDHTLPAAIFQGPAAPPPDSLPLPTDDMSADEISATTDDELPMPGRDSESSADVETTDQIEVPLFGRLSASKLGMPLFTLAIGLIDGFNPCAMWVLLFLLSILVNLKDRKRILAIAGTFVIVSGLAYFAFMAAWLNVFALIGYLRPIQIVLALMAIVIGTIHTKDFFAFRQGVSLSIPESAKPGIYARVRSIVTAEHMSGAVAGAITLAVLVNIVELLCTAGLPALYTNILMQQELSAAGRYAYLGLYILAYMFDDALMVGIVVITLSKRKLQETQGRWLKLISGVAILLLGVVMLFRPEWLH
jgi:glutaredoxin